MREAEGVGDIATGGGRPGPRQPGVVLEVRGRRATVLADGRFLRMRAIPGWEPGEEVWVAPPAPWTRRQRIWSMAVGLGLALAAGSGAWAGLAAAQTVALVSVDINPGVQFGVNTGGRVVSQQGTDAAGTHLLQSLHLRGEPLRTAVAAVVSMAIDEGYLGGGTGTGTGGVVLLGVAPTGAAQVPAKVQTQVDAARSGVVAVLAQHGVQATVPVVRATAQEAKKAAAVGVSVGDYYMASSVSAAKSHAAPRDLKGKDLSQTAKAAGVPTDDLGPVLQAIARDPKVLKSVLQQAEQGVPAATLEHEIAPPGAALATRRRSADHPGHGTGKGHRSSPGAGGKGPAGPGGPSGTAGGVQPNGQTGSGDQAPSGRQGQTQTGGLQAGGGDPVQQSRTADRSKTQAGGSGPDGHRGGKGGAAGQRSPGGRQGPGGAGRTTPGGDQGSTGRGNRRSQSGGHGQAHGGN